MRPRSTLARSGPAAPGERRVGGMGGGVRSALWTPTLPCASIVPVRAWMGHADVNTTMRYLDDKSRAGDARLLSPRLPR